MMVAKVNYLINGDDVMNAENIYQIRKFNRFYTRVLKLTDKYHLNTHTTILESRILLEIDRNVNTANQLLQLLYLDKGYLSRVLKKMKHDGLLLDVRADHDKRIKELQLTAEGKAMLTDINERADDQIRNLFMDIPPEQLEKIIQDMNEIRSTVKKYSDY